MLDVVAAGEPSRPEPPSEPLAPLVLPDPAPDGPMLTSVLHRLRAEAQGVVLRCETNSGLDGVAYASAEADSAAAPEVGANGVGPAVTLVQVGPRGRRCSPPPALARFVPIEPERALDHFHRALDHLAAGEDEDGKVRILAYGASHTQADLYTGYLRAYLQSRFGDGGQGFVLLGRVNRWYRTLETGVWHRGLRVRHARQRNVKDEPLGLFGAALLGTSGDGFAEIVTSKRSESTRFEVHYFAEPKGGSFTLSVDGKLMGRVATASNAPRPGYFPFETTPGRHAIRVRLNGNGPVRLFGITAETAAPGVVIDTLGINGSRMADNLRWQEAAWVDAVRRRSPDLVTFAYGTNEAISGLGSVTRYEQDVREVLTRLRKAAPEASCVLITPFDVSRREKGRWATPASLLETIEAQQRIAGELGCGLWNGFEFMGGEGSMAAWVKAKPPLASTDRIHLTRLGYVYAGVGFGDALMRAYDLERRSLDRPNPAGPMLQVTGP